MRCRDRLPRRIRAGSTARPRCPVRALLQQESALVPQHQHTGLALGDGLAHFGRGQLGLAAFAARDASVRDGASVAGGLAACAERGAQVHQPLRVRCHVESRRGVHLRMRQRPETLLDLALGRVARYAEVTGEHALDVAVQDGRTFAVRKRGNGRGRGPADAGQGGDGLGGGRKAAVPVAHDFLRAAMQVASARVIAQAGPVRHHVFLRGGGQRRDVWKALQKALVVGDDGGYLGLLQHDFG